MDKLYLTYMMWIVLLSEGLRSVRDINKLFLSPRTYFLPFSPSSGEDVIIVFAYAGGPGTAASRMGHFPGSCESNYSRSFPDRGGDAIYGFIRRCNNPSKHPPEGPNPELRGPGNDLVNRTAIMIS